MYKWLGFWALLFWGALFAEESPAIALTKGFVVLDISSTGIPTWEKELPQGEKLLVTISAETCALSSREYVEKVCAKFGKKKERLYRNLGAFHGDQTILQLLSIDLPSKERVFQAVLKGSTKIYVLSFKTKEEAMPLAYKEIAKILASFHLKVA